MQLYLNDRVLVPGQALKLLVLAPELHRADSEAGELGTSFAISDDQGSRLDFPVKRVDRETLRKLFPVTPVSAAEMATEGLKTGRYIVSASIGRNTIARHAVEVIGIPEYGRIVRMAGGDPLPRETPFEDVSQIGAAWNEAWAELFSYLQTPPPRHVVFQVNDKQLDFDRGTIRILPREALSWFGLQASRFVYDQLFYGGVANVGRGPLRDTLQFRVTMESSGLPLNRNPQLLFDLLRALRTKSGFRVEPDWKATAATKGYLDLTWR